jgi:hypothetical protein
MQPTLLWVQNMRAAVVHFKHLKELEMKPEMA